MYHALEQRDQSMSVTTPHYTSPLRMVHPTAERRLGEALCDPPLHPLTCPASSCITCPKSGSCPIDRRSPRSGCDRLHNATSAAGVPLRLPRAVPREAQLASERPGAAIARRVADWYYQRRRRRRLVAATMFVGEVGVRQTSRACATSAQKTRS